VQTFTDLICYYLVRARHQQDHLPGLQQVVYSKCQPLLWRTASWRIASPVSVRALHVRHHRMLLRRLLQRCTVRMASG
jgi:hypothetical protein